MKSHYHCWEQKQPPACGLKGEHKRCCLCEETNPSNEIKTVEDVVREFESVFPDSTGRHLYPTTMVECKDYIRTSITTLLKHAQSEIEKRKRIVFPGDSEQFKAPIHSANAAKDEDIGILEAMIHEEV